MKQELALQNLFLHLVENGFPLGVRDYRDALSALNMGYGMPGRQNLLWLCRALWARTEEEKRFLDILFNQFNFAVDEATKNLLERSEPSSNEDSHSAANKRNDRLPEDESQKTSQNASPAPAVNFASAADQKNGLGLTRARIDSAAGEYFILAARSIISVRRLTVIWRRFRAVKRDGPKVELDLDATIREKCRQGIISQPVLIPARRNQVKLIIAVDASPSMRPWMSFNKMLVSSLDKGQLGAAKIYYFHNTPEEVLYEKETLNKPKKIAAIIRETGESALLIISDGGAARGYENRQRVSETKKFLSDTAAFWHPVAWLNPMPSARWKHTTAERLKRILNRNMFELSEQGLIKAVDVLRGKKF